ncbi:homoserine kinase [Candidatus Formimonas warabiya]|uniref:Homoserine kinase n=1 Tax=Formimonas warabiya TaxID=1761012 RepID=A0A3G1KNW2_FORW1|nr:homoserine kinase [Candidatus Formimonas warabiya]ATW24116.1 homoserine kinase [Candidatus Formimonas warabiya]
MLKIRVPATSGNLGPGFDTIGMAFELYNDISFELIPSGLNIDILGEGASEIPRRENNKVFQAAKKVFDKVNFSPSGLKIILENNIPIARGLGSSASIIVGGMVAANELSGKRLSDQEILKMAVEMEGHPDNVAPALFGGVTAAVSGISSVDYLKILPPRKLHAIVAIPDFQLSTETARQVIPTMVDRSDAVFNIGRTSLMIGALLKEDLALFGKMMEDRLHQPYRMSLIPGMREVFSLAKEAGALSVAISGAGPTLIAFVVGDGRPVAEAMSKAFTQQEISCKTLDLYPDLTGTKIISS